MASANESVHNADSGFEMVAPDEAATLRLGAALAAGLDRVLSGPRDPGFVIALTGNLGAGKTRLVQAIAIASGVDRRSVTSPTFMLVQEYEGRWPVFHFDTYRLTGVQEFLDLGAEEYFATRGASIVEWADRITSVLPADHLNVQIEILGETERRFRIAATGIRAQTLIEEAKTVLGTWAD